MNRSRATAPQWSVRADQILSDGQWHDGMQLVREIEKKVIPGLALRRVEAMRESRLRAHGKEGQARKVARSERRLIANGKRGVVQAFILSRINRGSSYETLPSPIPPDGWQKGGWLIRDIRVHRSSLSALAKRYGLAQQTLRSLVLADPPIPHRTTARTISLEDGDLPLLDARVEEYKREALQRRGERARAAHEQRRQAPKDRIALSNLARQCGIGPETAQALRKVCPQLGWIERGRTTYLPVEQIPDFEVVVAAYQQGGRPGKARNELVPAFKDEKLTELFGRYVAGERHLRDEVFAQMRRVYHEAGDT